MLHILIDLTVAVAWIWHNCQLQSPHSLARPTNLTKQSVSSLKYWLYSSSSNLKLYWRGYKDISTFRHRHTLLKYDLTKKNTNICMITYSLICWKSVPTFFIMMHKWRSITWCKHSSFLMIKLEGISRQQTDQSGYFFLSWHK